MESHSQSSDPAPFFRVFRFSWPWRVGSPLIATLSAVYVAANWNELSLDANDGKPGYLFIASAVMVVAIGITVHTLTSSVRFTADTVIYKNVFGPMALPIEHIRGRREYVADFGRSGSVPYLNLVSDDEKFPSLNFSRRYNFDDAFYKWFYSLPDRNQPEPAGPKSSDFELK